MFARSTLRTAPHRDDSREARRIVSVLLTFIGVALTALLLGGLAPTADAAGSSRSPDSPLSTESAEAQEPVSDVKATLTIWSWDIARKALIDTVPSFHEKYPNVNVDVQEISWSKAMERLTISLAAGGVGLPDVVQVGTVGLIPSYLQYYPGAFIDLRQFGAQRYADLFDPSAWQVGVYDGGVYSIPWDTGPAGIFYRTDVFKAAGVDPANIETWADFLQAGIHIKEATGKALIPLNFNSGYTFFRLLVNQQRASLFNETGAVDLANPAAVRALNYIRALNDAGVVVPAEGKNDLVALVQNDRVAAIPNAVWFAGLLADQASGENGLWRAMALPAFEPGGPHAATLGGSNMMIPTTSAHPEIAWAFIENAVAGSGENQVIMFDRYALFPGYLPALDDPVLDRPVPFYGGQKIWRIFADTVSDIPPMIFTSDYPLALEALKQPMGEVLLRDRDPEAALRDAAEQLARRTGRPVAATSR